MYFVWLIETYIQEKSLPLWFSPYNHWWWRKQKEGLAQR